MNHAEDTIVLVHEDFLPVIEQIRDRLTTVRAFVLLKDGKGEPKSLSGFDGEYEDLLSMADDGYDFPDFSEDAQATVFYTTGTTGSPKGVYYSHRQLVLHTLSTAVALGCFTAQGRFQSADVYMPITPDVSRPRLGHPLRGDSDRSEAGLPPAGTNPKRCSGSSKPRT